MKPINSLSIILGLLLLVISFLLPVIDPVFTLRVEILGGFLLVIGYLVELEERTKK